PPSPAASTSPRRPSRATLPPFSASSTSNPLSMTTAVCSPCSRGFAPTGHDCPASMCPAHRAYEGIKVVGELGARKDLRRAPVKLGPGDWLVDAYVGHPNRMLAQA